MNYRIFLSVLALSLFALTGCVSHAPKEAQWPTDMPSRDTFVALYDADLDNKPGQDVDEYLLWVTRFYKGWELYRNGWSKVTVNSLDGVTDAQLAAEIKTKMDLIGIRIAGEWAKNKSDRRIYTRHVIIWGNALVESIKRGEELKLINRVLNDVNNLMANEIGIDDIKAERYYAKDDDVFG